MSKAPKHPVDDLTLADGFVVHEMTGHSLDEIRYILRYPSMFTVMTMLKVMTGQEVANIIEHGATPEADGIISELELQGLRHIADDLQGILRDAHYQYGRMDDTDTPEPDAVRDYALERMEREIKGTKAESYPIVIACLGWVWSKKDNPTLTYEEYIEETTQTEAKEQLENMINRWVEHRLGYETDGSKEDEEENKRVPLDSDEETK